MNRADDENDDRVGEWARFFYLHGEAIHLDDEAYARIMLWYVLSTEQMGEA